MPDCVRVILSSYNAPPNEMFQMPSPEPQVPDFCPECMHMEDRPLNAKDISPKKSDSGMGDRKRTGAQTLPHRGNNETKP